jgi:glycosyltransferase involved in cell wall biosynthesis
MAHADLPDLYAAADVLLLPSSREGWANVLLEAMACGTPVVATDVNGTGEVVRSRAAGMLMPERTSQCLIETLGRLRSDMPARADTRRYAEAFGWASIGRANGTLLRAAAVGGFDGRHAPGVLDPVRRLLSEPNPQTHASPEL